MEGRSPSESPRYADRFLPNRNVSNLSSILRSVDSLDDEDRKNETYDRLIENELSSEREDEGLTMPASKRTQQVLSYSTPGKERRRKPRADILTASPLSMASRQILLRKRDRVRYIPKTPFKVLHAPSLRDDFYLNLLCWSSKNVIAVALSKQIFLWNGDSGTVSTLCKFSNDDPEVTSIEWMQRGTHLAVGFDNGLLQLWDVEKKKKVRTLLGHSKRIVSLSWNTSILTSGGRDCCIYHRDVRQKEHYVRTLKAHRQAVCGLSWSPDGEFLASGGNDNKVFIWSLKSEKPILQLLGHQAAVKALTWSPYDRGLLCSGGGTNDRVIRFWNTLTEQALNSVDTGSQVCNLSWSPKANEIVSTHGFSQNQIIIWDYASLDKIVVLTGHTNRVVYLAMSDDGDTIVTGAGDETLRFWNIFSKSEFEDISPHGSLR